MYVRKKPQADCSWFSPNAIIHLKVVGHVPKFSFTEVLAKYHPVF
nr:MAG TPA: hypothetical protein [Caudoviricetes sp.]